MAQDRIRVELRRTGGFAGTEVRSSLDSTTLDPNEAADLANVVSGIDLAALTEARGGGPPVPDAMRYELTIERGTERVRVDLTEPAVPVDVRPLLQRLVAAARR